MNMNIAIVQCCGGHIPNYCSSCYRRRYTVIRKRNFHHIYAKANLMLVEIYMTGAHHIDLRAATAEDPNWLVEQRETEVKLIKGWLDNYYQEKKAVFDDM